MTTTRGTVATTVASRGRARAAYEAEGVLIKHDLHTYLALAGLGGMALAASIATVGWARKDESLRDSVTRWVLAPWAVRVFVFVWATLERGPLMISGSTG